VLFVRKMPFLPPQDVVQRHLVENVKREEKRVVKEQETRGKIKYKNSRKVKL
jgi:hypothetical protein